MQFDLFAVEKIEIDDDDDDDDIDYSHRGKRAEHIVAGELINMGHECYSLNANGFDLLLVTDRAYRVQVKSSSNIKSGNYHWNIRISNTANKDKNGKRPLTRDDADILALYHWNCEHVLFLPISSLATSITFTPSQFKQTIPRDSLDQTLKAL
jgi:hypothetical protein